MVRYDQQGRRLNDAFVIGIAGGSASGKVWTCPNWEEKYFLIWFLIWTQRRMSPEKYFVQWGLSHLLSYSRKIVSTDNIMKRNWNYALRTCMTLITRMLLIHLYSPLWVALRCNWIFLTMYIRSSVPSSAQRMRTNPRSRLFLQRAPTFRTNSVLVWCCYCYR
jgi:hypothetical protein